MKVILFTLLVIGAVQAKPAFHEKLQPFRSRHVLDDAFKVLASLEEDISTATAKLYKVQDDVSQLSHQFSYKIDTLLNEEIYQSNFPESCLNENIDDIFDVTSESYKKADECYFNTHAKFEKVHESLLEQQIEISKKYDDIFDVIRICYDEDPESRDECLENKREEVNDLVNETVKQTEEVIETNESQTAVIKNEYEGCLDGTYETAVEKVKQIVEKIKDCVDNQPTDQPIIAV